ncbi:unnamed protein product [Lactuca saligna]|uniref:AIPP2-like SPOC-like domain-containing protein n=1 Tax=Lactuca saligna TaxID=75948 RepID=A0AA36A1N9_LACSI|nr:unnamed protein product [Lactuca saligna]
MEKADEISDKLDREPINDVTIGKNRTSENKQRTTSETSNLESVSSSYSTENAESKVNMKISDTKKFNYPNGLEHRDEPNMLSGSVIQNTVPSSSTSIDVEKSSHSSDEHENIKVSVGNQKDIVTQTQKKEVGTNNDDGNLPEDPLKEQGVEEEKVENAPAAVNVKDSSADDSDESDVVEHDVKVCDICGDAGREDLLAICCRCIDGAEHTYCMKKMIDQVPEGDWLCEECKLSEENKRTNSSGQTDTEPASTFIKPGSKRPAGEEPRASKDQIKVSGKRRLEESESFTSVKKQALEMITGSPRTSSPSRLHAVTDSPRLQSSKGAFFKSNSFNFSNAKSKTRLVDEIVLQRQKSIKERDSHDSREMGKSTSFRSTNTGRFGTSGSKVKMLSPNPSHVPDLKSLKNKKERSFERSNSIKLPSVSNLSTSSSSGLTPKVDKSQVSSPGVGTASSGNGITNSMEPKPVVLKDENTSKQVVNKESTNLADGVKESSNSTGLTPGTSGYKHTGHSAQTHTADKVQVSNASGVRNTKEVKNRDNKLKDAIEAALLKKPGLVRKNRVSDQSDESPAEVLTDCQGQLSRSSSVDHSKQSNGNNLKHFEGKHSTMELSSYDPVSMSSSLLKVPAIPDHEYIWQGSFEINRSGKTAEFWDGLQAHLSTCASPKVFEAVNNLPHKIHLNGVSRISAWPEQFENSGVKEDNIALYFFAKDVESYEKSYQVLLDDMIRGDLALIGSINGVELLIFPSNQLPEKSHRWNMLFFLWGVFRGKKKKADHPAKNVASSIPADKISTVEDVPLPLPGSMDKDKHVDLESKVNLKLPTSSSSSQEKATIDSTVNVVPAETVSFKPDINETLSMSMSVSSNKTDDSQHPVVKYTRNPKVEQIQSSFLPQVPTQELIESKKRAFIDLSEDDDDITTTTTNQNQTNTWRDASTRITMTESKKQKSDAADTYEMQNNINSAFSPDTDRVGLGLDLNEDIMTKKDDDDMDDDMSSSLSLSLAFSPGKISKDEGNNNNRHSTTPPSMLLFRDIVDDMR